MPHICIIIHICRIFLVNYAVDFLILSIFKGDFSQNKKKLRIFMQKTLDIHAYRAYSMHCQGEIPHLYTARWFQQSHFIN